MTLFASAPAVRRGDFAKYWAGQTISNLGSAITGFALPLIVYKLTGSALNLGIAAAASFLPYLLFGLLIGAWVDRVDRKRLMIATDVARGALLASIPLLAAAHLLAVEWIYAVGFLSTTLTIAFEAGEFAAIPSLVGRDALVEANGRIQASYSAAGVAGPLLAGLLVSVMPVDQLLFLDATSFGVSAASLALVATRFNTAAGSPAPAQSLVRDVAEGLRYVVRHPVLRNIAIMMALINFVGVTFGAQIVTFAKEQLAAGDSQVGWLYAAESLGMVGGALLAGPIRRRWAFSPVILGSLLLDGLAITAVAFTRDYLPALGLSALGAGTGILFNINTGSLRQAIVPDHLLGRVMTSARVLSWGAIPLGALAGGWAIEATGSVALVFAGIGILTVIIPLIFARTALGHADRYLPADSLPESDAALTPAA